MSKIVQALSAAALALVLGLASTSAQTATQAPSDGSGCSIDGNGWSGAWVTPWECNQITPTLWQFGNGSYLDYDESAFGDDYTMRTAELTTVSDLSGQYWVSGTPCSYALDKDGEPVNFISPDHAYYAMVCDGYVIYEEFWSLSDDHALQLQIYSPMDIDEFHAYFDLFIEAREGIMFETDAFDDDPIPFGYEIESTPSA